MKKIFLVFVLLVQSLLSYSSNIQSAVAIAIFDKNGNGENIQHSKISYNDYNGICYSKIAVFGFLNQSKVKVIIGNSRGTQIKSIPINNEKNIQIGQEITFKHYTVKSGQFKVYIDDKLYDAKVFIK